MKIFRGFLLLFVLVVCACGDDEGSSSFTEPSSNALFVQCNIDGSAFEIVHLQGTQVNGQISYGDGQHADQGHCLFTQYTDYAAYNSTFDELTSEYYMEIGFAVKHAPGTVTSGYGTTFLCGDFEIPLNSVPEDEINRNGNNAYAGIFQDQNGNNDAPTEGVIINLYDANETRWTSYKAANSSSDFTITEWDGSYYGTIIAATFSCTLVDEAGNTKVITDGKMRGLFFW